MTVVRRFGLADLIVFLLIVAGAAGARAWYLINYADNGQNNGPLLVQDPPPTLEVEKQADAAPNGQAAPNEQDALLANLKEHKWFGSLAPFALTEEPTAHVSPGYPWLRYWLSQIPGAAVDDVKLRWIQVGLGALTAGLYFLFALRAFQSLLVALLAGLLCAANPFWIIDSAVINDGTLASFLLAACIFLGVRSGQSGGALSSLLYGLALAGLALVRAALLPFSFVALIWFLGRARQVPRGWLCGLLAVLGFANGLAPWALRNWQVFHEVVPIVDSTFLHLWIGNNQHATGGPLTDDPTKHNQTMLTALWHARHESAGTSAESWQQELSDKSQPERYLSLAKDVWEEIKARPGKALDRRLWAGLYFFFGADFFKPGHELTRFAPDNNESVLKERWLQLSYKALPRLALFIMLTLGVLGWRWTYGWRHLAMPSSLALIWVPLPYLLSHAEWLSGPRLPLDGVLLSYAAFALACFVPGVGRILLAGPEVEEEEQAAPPVRPVVPPPPPRKEEKPAGYPGTRNPFA
jgi:4-amino-4-deoxy-L-arabinose transferase-like glycosyltransferase